MKCAASEVIAHEGAVADCLFVLVRGTAGVTKLVDGEAVPVHQYADGTLGRVQPPRPAPPLRARGGGHTLPSAHRPPDWRRTRHVWAPSAGFVINDARQDRIAIKEVGLVEYCFQPDSLEVRHVRAAGQRDVDIEELLAQMGEH